MTNKNLTTILGEKLKQSQRFNERGERMPVTIIKAGPCTVVQIKEKEKDGYKAIQLGFGIRKEKNLKLPVLGHLKKAGITKAPRFLREVRLKSDEEDLQFKKGDLINVGDIFKVGDTVNVTGVSKGKGFTGVVKRHHFKGGPRTHGQSDRERAPGAIGQTTTPGRVYKGKRMAGRAGGERVTIKNLKVIEVDCENNQLVVSGLIPGGRHSFVTIVKAHLI